MQFTNPIGLWALLGLTLPVAIHLLSRKEGKVIRIGSLRHLHETNTQQFKGIRLNELVLLALRSLMVVLFVLLLSGLSFNQNTKSEAKWVLIEKGLENNASVKPQLEKFQQDGFELRWLVADFPFLQDSSSSSNSINYRELSEKLISQNFTEAIVLARNRIDGFTGIKTALPSNVRWLSIESEPTEYTLNAIKLGDSVSVRTGYTSADKTYFVTQKQSTSAWNEKSDAIDTLQIAVVSDQSHQYDKKIIEAALKSIRQSFPVEMQVSYKSIEQEYANQEWIIWLASQQPPVYLSKVLYLKPETGNEIIIEEARNRWRITKSLNEEVALKGNLTIQLAKILIQSEKYATVAAAYDMRMIPDSVAWIDQNSNTKAASLPLQSADSFLIGLLLLTLLVERLLAYHRNQ